MPFTKGQPRKKAAAKEGEVVDESPEEELEAAPQEQTIVPTQFLRLSDGALTVAMDAYHRTLDAGREEQHAITDGVIAAKNWAVTSGQSWRR